MGCHGNGKEHCCWFKGEQCSFLEENTVSGRRWSCGLYNELQDWDKVLADKRYIKIVQPKFDATNGLKFANCRDWPQAYPEIICSTKGLCCYGD